MRTLIATLVAVLIVGAASTADASRSHTSTIVTSDFRFIVIEGRCNTILVGGGGYCINRDLRK